MLKKIKRNAEVLAHIFTILQKAIGTHVRKGSNKAARCLLKRVLLQIGLHSMLAVKTPAFFQKLVSVQNCSLFFLHFCPFKSLHSNAKTPSFEILSQYIATFFLVASAS